MNDLSKSGTPDPRATVADAVASARRALTALTEEMAGYGAEDPRTAKAIASTQEILDRLAPQANVTEGLTVSDSTMIAFDVSDLLAYFPHNRAPTGIQRVQMEVITSLMEGDVSPRIKLCRFLKDQDRWAEVSVTLFLDLCAASKTGADPGEKGWHATYDRLDAASRGGDVMPFQPGSILVNLGSSWWLPNYFLQIRHLKDTLKIRYVPLIHDLIPAVAPQYCMSELVTEFSSWIVSVLEHADYFLAVSEASKRDLIDLAAKVGHEIEPDLVGVVSLNADFRAAASNRPAAAGSSVVTGQYVLFVSTLELRKNQLGALDAWRALINEYGVEKVPQLVLVGKRGFLGNQVAERLSRDDLLSKRVTLLSGVDDDQLVGLYRKCLFTLYPSHYEGWGLPVTESLCYGKVPLLSDSSSLPEAGGSLAVYFAAGSGSELLVQLRKLIFDEPYRKRLERKISSDFRPRSWTEIAMHILSMIDRWAVRSEPPAALQPPVAERGYYYELSAGTSLGVSKDMGSAEFFRKGIYWWEMDPWGSWSKPAGGGLWMRIAGEGPARLAIELRGLPDKDCDVEIRSRDGDLLASCTLGRGRIKWLFVDVPAGQDILDIALIGSQASMDVKTDIHGTTERKIGVGVKGFFIVDQSDPDARARFYEAVALGSLHDLSYFRRRLAG